MRLYCKPVTLIDAQVDFTDVLFKGSYNCRGLLLIVDSSVLSFSSQGLKACFLLQLPFSSGVGAGEDPSITRVHLLCSTGTQRRCSFRLCVKYRRLNTTLCRNLFLLPWSHWLDWRKPPGAWGLIGILTIWRWPLRIKRNPFAWEVRLLSALRFVQHRKRLGMECRASDWPASWSVSSEV